MFSTISWHQYFVTIIILVSAYYIIIALVYYRKKLRLFFVHGLGKRSSAPATISLVTPPEEKVGVLSNTVRELIEELNILFKQVGRQEPAREEFIMALQARLRNYQTIKGTKFQDSIEEHIYRESKTCCNIEFDEVELRRLW